MIFPYIIRVLRVARNGGQALVTPLDRFLYHARVCRGVTMLRPRQDAIPERALGIFAVLCAFHGFLFFVIAYEVKFVNICAFADL